METSYGATRDGPDDTVLVVVLLDGGGKGAGHAHAVATHQEWLLNAILVGERRSHGLGILGAELEDLRHLDAARAGEGRAAVRAGSPATTVMRSSHASASKSRPGQAPVKW